MMCRTEDGRRSSDWHSPRLSRREWVRAALGGAVAAAAGCSTAGPQALPPASEPLNGRAYDYMHIDVFTDTPLSGNQLAVFLDPDGLDSDEMQAMTREINFSEATFVLPAETPDTDMRVRIFGRTREMPFAGHPTIGTAFALARAGRIEPGRGRYVLGLGIGPTPLDLEWRDGRLAFVWMDQLTPTYGLTLEDQPALEAALGLPAGSILPDAPIQEVSCGSMFLYVPLVTREAVDAVVLNASALAAVFAQAGMDRRGLFVFSPEAGDDGATVYSRMLGATGSEDPGTGSASGPLGCYLVRHGLVPRERAADITSRQGVKMNRPCTIFIRIGTEGDSITRVQVGGTSLIIGSGTLVI